MINTAISLYIHFPFCRKKCRYCDFYSVFDQSDYIDAYIHALKKEWELVQKKYHLDDTIIQTVYCGGGTPSLLSANQWEAFASFLIDTLSLSDALEWTIECNPESFTEEKTAVWSASGVTRITIGIQSFSRRELAVLGRVHDKEQVLAMVSHPVLQKFRSVGADIMYGIPGQNLASLDRTLHSIFSYPVINHVSAYELTIADNTPFGRHKRILPLPSEERIMEMTGHILSEARAHGFKRYEVSNYCKPGFACRHNEAYWNHAPYIGLGASAHSYINHHRYSNYNALHTYLHQLSADTLPVAFTEFVDNEKLERELIFLRLRTCEGLDENKFALLTGKPFNNSHREKTLAQLLEEKYFEYTPPFWRLTDRGMLVADAIVRKLVLSSY